MPPLILPVKILVVHLLVSLGYFPPFYFPLALFIIRVFGILCLFFPIMPLSCLNTSCLQILKTPWWEKKKKKKKKNNTLVVAIVHV